MTYNDTSHNSPHWMNFGEGYKDRASKAGPIEPTYYPLDWFSVMVISFMVGVTATVSAFAMGWLS